MFITAYLTYLSAPLCTYIWKKNLNANKGIFKILFLRVLECTQNRQIGFLPGLLVVSLHFYLALTKMQIRHSPIEQAPKTLTKLFAFLW